MNLERLRMWTDALINDTDGQCVGELVDMRGCHCAVGVGLKVAGLPLDQAKPQAEQIDRFCEWLGVRAAFELPTIAVEGYGVRSVFGLNDQLHWSLREIGIALEREYLTPATT